MRNIRLRYPYGMRVLVIGGTGFIGPHIVERLLAFGHEVTVFCRGISGANLPKSVSVIHGDRNSLHQSVGDLRRLHPEVVVDLIAFTEQQAESLVATIRGITERIVVLSSGDVYRAYDILLGRVAGAIEATPLTESSPIRERLYPYRGSSIPQPDGFSWDDYEKILVERAILRDTTFVRPTVLRLPMVYGPGAADMSKRRFFPYLKRMVDGRPAILLDERSARWKVPWGYVGDVAEAVRLAVENERAASEIYNVGESDKFDLERWIRELAALTGWTGELVVTDQPCPPPSLSWELNLEQHLDMDTTKIRRDLGYRETVSRHEALEKTIAWDRQHWPMGVDPAQFDYASEDAILNRLRMTRS